MPARAGVDLASLIRDIPDFPKPGVLFKDITPLLASAERFREAVRALASATTGPVDVVVGTEARGFIFGAPVALELGVGFVPVRKPGKLPSETLSASYDLEYGSETLSIHADSVAAGARVLVVDDVLATGGTLAATGSLLRQLGVGSVTVSVLMELTFLGGRQLLAEQGIETVNTVLSFGAD